jgi:hypothetical protein
MQSLDAWMMALPTIQENRGKAKVLDNLYNYFDKFWDIDRHYVMNYLNLNQKASPNILDGLHKILHENDRNTQIFENLLEGLSPNIKENIIMHASSQLLTFEEVLLEIDQEPPFIYFLIRGNMHASLLPNGVKQMYHEGALIGIGNIFGTRSFFEFRVASKFAFVMKINWVNLLRELRDEKPQEMFNFLIRLSDQFLQDKATKMYLKTLVVPEGNLLIIIRSCTIELSKDCSAHTNGAILC